jgi:hypothetical protein
MVLSSLLRVKLLHHEGKPYNGYRWLAFFYFIFFLLLCCCDIVMTCLSIHAIYACLAVEPMIVGSFVGREYENTMRC